MADIAFVPSKQNLKMSTMKTVEYWEVIKEKENYFAWAVCSFKSLKKNVEYWSLDTDLNWVFTIIKRNNSCSITIYTGDYDNEIDCSVCYNRDAFSSSIIANRISKSVQKVHFPYNMVDVPENTYLQTGKLLVMFKFNKYCEISNYTLNTRDTNDPSSHECINSILRVTNSFRYVDFFIFVGENGLINGLIPANKAILAARSSYFREYIKENFPGGEDGNIVVDSTHDAMSIITQFIYTGRVLLKSSDDLAPVLALSEKFGLSRLATFIKKCMENAVMKKLRAVKDQFK